MFIVSYQRKESEGWVYKAIPCQTFQKAEIEAAKLTESKPFLTSCWGSTFLTDIKISETKVLKVWDVGVPAKISTTKAESNSIWGSEQ